MNRRLFSDQGRFHVPIVALALGVVLLGRVAMMDDSAGHDQSEEASAGPPVEACEPAGRQTGAENFSDVNALQWRLGAIARDEHHDPITAAHWFFRAARSAGQSGNDQRARDFLLAAQNAAAMLHRTFVHDGAVNQAVFSPDGQSILTVSDDRTARLWDVRDGRLLRTFQHNGVPRRAVFSPDGNLIFTWGRRASDEHSWLWDVTKDEPIREFGDEFGRIVDVVFTADSSRFFIWNDERRTWDAGRKGTLWLWDVEQDQPELMLRDYVEPWPSNRRVPEPIIIAEKPPLNSRDDFDGCQAELRKKRELVQKLPHPAPVKAAVFSPEGDRVLSWCQWRSNVPAVRETVWLWDAREKELLRSFRHAGGIAGAAFDREAQRFLTWNDVGRRSPTWNVSPSVRVWHVEGTQRPFTVGSDLRFEGAAFAPEGGRVLVWSEDGSSRLWNLQSPELLVSFRQEEGIRQAMVGRRSKRVFTRSPLAVRMWDAEEGRLLRTFSHDDFRGDLNGPVFNADQTRFLTWNANNTLDDEVVLSTDRGFVWVWDVEREEPLRSFLHDGWITDAVLSADGSRVLSASEDRTVRLWDVDENRLLGTYRHEGYILAVEFNADETRIAARTTTHTPRPDRRSEGRTIWIWDAADDAEPLVRLEHPRVRGVTFNAANTQLITTGQREARLWDLKSGELLQTVRLTIRPEDEQQTERTVLSTISPQFEELITGAMFNQDDTPHIVTRHTPRRVSRYRGRLRHGEERVWKMGEDQPIASRPVLRASGPRATQDGTRSISGSAGGLLTLFSVEVHEPLLRLRTPHPVSSPSYLHGSAFSPDERRFLTWGVDRSHEAPYVVRLWDVALRDERPIDRQLLDHQIRSGTHLDSFGHTQPLPFNKWRELVQTRGNP